MGSKKGSGDVRVPVTHYFMSTHFGICHGILDSINAIYFNDKLAWDGSPEPTGPVDNIGPIAIGIAQNLYLPEDPYHPEPEKIIDPNGFLTSSMFRQDWALAFKGGFVRWHETDPSPWEQPEPVWKQRRILELRAYDYDTGHGESPVYELRIAVILDPDDGGPPGPHINWITEGGDAGRLIPGPGSAQEVTIYPANWTPEGEGEPEPPPGPQPVTSQTTIYINRPDLFGGKLREGGVVGNCHLMMGNYEQLVPGELAAKVGRDSNTMPAYRGVANAWFYGNPGFYWSSNRNFLPDVSINCTRIPRGDLPAHLARIGPDVNPAHIIYECLTNPDWGMGAPVSSIDTAAFGNAAQTLFDERFGLSMMWSDQMEIEKFVNEVIDHIEGSLFVHPRTGKFVLKLIRDDYEVDDLPIYTPDNAKLANFQRKAWGETINEITITYKNPENEEDISFTIQDNANIAMQGAVITDNRNYYGIRNPELAARVAERDLRTASAPLCSCDIEINRDAWDLVPGDVVRITWPEYGINELVMRVGPVDYGRPGEPRVRASLIEDVFFLPEESFFVPPKEEWVDPRETAVPVPIVKIISLPFYLALRVSGYNEQTFVNQIQYPESAAGVLASTYQIDAINYDLYTERPNTLGDLEFRYNETNRFVGYARMTTAIGREARSRIKFEGLTPKGGPSIGGFALLGDADDRETELVAFEEFDLDLGWRIRRGVLDTVPKAWPVDTPIRFLDGNVDIWDGMVRFDGDVARYKLLTRTSLNLLEARFAPIETGDVNGRPHYPLRPANVRLNGILWGELLEDGGYLRLTWSTRSRLQETSVILSWDDGSTVPESGQTTRVRWYDHEGNVLLTASGLTGVEHTLNFSQIPGPAVKYVIDSERDGLESLQFVEEEIEVCGWGMNWGNYYSGKS